MAKKKILVVDDEPHLLRLVDRVLTKEGYKVGKAGSGKDALNKLKKDSKFDLVLVDYFMPKMSGLVLCEKIRKDPNLKDIKIIFLTVAEFGETGRDTLTKMGVLDYITKPFDNNDLIWRIDKILKK